MDDHGDAPSVDAGASEVATLLSLIGSSWKTQAIRAAAELGIADALAHRPVDVDTLAVAVGAHRDSLARLMRALLALGLVDEREAGRYSLTATGALLRADTDTSLHAWARWWGGYPWDAWGRLHDSVRTGGAARAASPGHEAFGFLAAEPEAGAAFHRAMAALTRLVARELVRVHDFRSVRRVVDVGGGTGTLLESILRTHPALHGTLLELPSVIEHARAALRDSPVAHRCALAAGSFFDAVPAGADRYLLKSVLHNWDDARCATLLATCRAAMSPGARLLLVERTLPERIVDSPAVHAVVQSDLNMLVGPGGRERTSAAIRTMLSDAGFDVVATSRIATGHDVVEAMPQSA